MSLRYKSVALLFLSGVFIMLLVAGAPLPASATSSRESMPTREHQKIQEGPFGGQSYGTSFGPYEGSYGASNTENPFGDQSYGTSFRSSRHTSSDTPVNQVMGQYSARDVLVSGYGRSRTIHGYLWCAARGGKFVGFIHGSYPRCAYTYPG